MLTAVGSTAVPSLDRRGRARLGSARRWFATDLMTAATATTTAAPAEAIFSWLPIHREAAGKLLGFRERSGELVEILQRMHVAGLRAMPIEDKDAEGRRFPLAEIDPFSFLANFNRGVTDANRRALWEFLKREWELTSPVPEDFHGIPTANLQNSWLIPYLPKRDADQVPLLWEFFEHILAGDLGTLDTALMDRCLDKRGVGLAFLTMGMFWVKPEAWIAADGKNVAFAKSRGVARKPRDAAEYRKWAGKVIAEAGGEVLRFSRDAHFWALELAGAQAVILGAEAEFGAPFDDLFDDAVEANRVLDIFRDALLILQSGQTARASGITVTMTKPRGCWLMRVNAWQWVVMDYNARGLWLALTTLDFAKQHTGQQDLRAFAKLLDDESYYGLGGLSENEFRSDAVQTAFHDALRIAGDVFAFGNPMPRAEAHRPELYDAIMFPAMRADILSAGLLKPGGTSAAKSLDSRPVWLIAPGENANLWPQWQVDGVAAIGWNEARDLSDLEDIEAFREAVAAGCPEAGADKVARMLHDFAVEMKPGDVVVAKQGTKAVVGWGVVTGEYRHEESAQPFAHVRSVEWREDRRVELPDSIRLLNKTLTGYRDGDPLLDFLEAQYRFLDVVEAAIDTVAEYTLEQALDDLFVETAAFDRMMSLLRRKKNLILQGAPGTGKTYIADRLAFLLMGVKDRTRLTMVQFHQSTSYEDFIQGFRPDDEGHFLLKNGVFYDFCRTAADDLEQKYVFVIDEINRGNLAKIFGELMLLIEPDKRGEAHAIRLVYGDKTSEPFFVPSNVYLIGTMNTADRSLSLVDYALRRRFAFFEMTPGFESPAFAAKLAGRGVSAGMVARIRSMMLALNERIGADLASLGSGYRIGHSFFVPRSRVADEEQWLGEVVEYEILPLVEEYWADDPKVLNEVRALLMP